MLISIGHFFANQTKVIQNSLYLQSQIFNFRFKNT